jgi:hypothetical protein
MKVFVAWSGDLSKSVALALRDWLPNVIQSLQVFMSDQDIAKGARWFEEVSKELQDSGFGIVCLTWENREAPWLHFEAGAIANGLGKNRVTALLVDLPVSEIKGPLTEFQATELSREDLWKLVQSLNATQDLKDRLEDQRLKMTFSTWWPQLDGRLKRGLEEAKTTVERTYRSERDILEEILELARYSATMGARLRAASIPLAVTKNILEMRDVTGLTAYEAFLLSLAFGIGGRVRTTEEISQLVGLTPEEADQKIEDAIRRVKKLEQRHEG